jgi:hypothetical protein
MQEFQSHIGIDRKQSSYLQYVNTLKHLKQYLKKKYNIKDIPLSQLNLPFIEDFDFYLRVERKLKPASVNGVIVQLLSAARKALHRNLINHPPFFRVQTDKTGVPFNVKLLDIPIRIIEKYRDFSNGNFVFNIYYQMKINKLLKDIAKLCRIDKILTFHVGRHIIFSSLLRESKLQEYFS